MANYRRLISYIYAYEGGIKGKNVGFAKLEVRNGQCKLQVNVRNVYIGSQDTGVFLLCGSEEILVGKIFIRNGAGEFRAIVPVNNVAGSGQSIDKCYGLTVHNLADSWQSYTTIWEDAVTHAAEVVLAEATSEQMEKNDMGNLTAAATTELSQETGAEPPKKSIADAIEAEIEAQSPSPDPIPSSMIPPMEPQPPQFLRPSELEVMEVKPLETVSPIGGGLDRKEEKEKAAAGETGGELGKPAEGDEKTERISAKEEPVNEAGIFNPRGLGGGRRQPGTSQRPRPSLVSRPQSMPSRQQMPQPPSAQAQSGQPRSFGGRPSQPYYSPMSQRRTDQPETDISHQSLQSGPEPPQPQVARFQPNSPEQSWWNQAVWNIMSVSQERMGQSQPEVVKMEQDSGGPDPEAARRKDESGQTVGEAVEREQELVSVPPESMGQEPGLTGTAPEAAPMLEAAPREAGLRGKAPEDIQPDQGNQGFDGMVPEAAQLGQGRAGRLPETVQPDQGSAGSGLEAAWPEQELGEAVPEDIQPDQGNQGFDGMAPEAVQPDQETDEVMPEAARMKTETAGSEPKTWGMEQGFREERVEFAQPEPESGGTGPFGRGAVRGQPGQKPVPGQARQESIQTRWEVKSGPSGSGQINMKPESNQGKTGTSQLPPGSGQATPGYSQPGSVFSQPGQVHGQTRPTPGQSQPEQEKLEEEPKLDTIWQHFYKSYPKIQAFDYNGGCDILTIKPQDIGLLPREVWGYGNNSFLLHGYYSHRYLILARLNNPKGDPRFLLGVPGHYYSNEKYMAAMFGFPNFVLSKIQPAGDGRFGYWYTDIRLGYGSYMNMRT